MQAHQVTVFAIDFEQLGREGVLEALESARFPNHCLSLQVLDIQTRDIGPWDDDHPLNKQESADSAREALFGPLPAHTTPPADDASSKVPAGPLSVKITQQGSVAVLQAHVVKSWEDSALVTVSTRQKHLRITGHFGGDASAPGLELEAVDESDASSQAAEVESSTHVEFQGFEGWEIFSAEPGKGCVRVALTKPEATR